MYNNCSECPVLPRVEALEEANRQHGRAHEGMYDRIRALETENAVQNAHWVRDLTGKAGKRWDKAVETVLAAAVTGLVCFLLGRLGL